MGIRLLFKKRFIVSTVMAWLLFLMVDFLAHASLLRPFWAREYPALKPSSELFYLIPLGYLSFLLLTVLIGWVYVRVYGEKGNTVKGLSLGAVFGGLFGLATFFGWYSAIALPALFVFLIGLVYSVEFLLVGFTYGFLLHRESTKKRLWFLAAVIVAGLVAGVVFQNL